MLSVVGCQITEHFRTCPQCLRHVYYATEKAATTAANANRPCRWCVARKPRTKRGEPSYRAKSCVECAEQFVPKGGRKLRCQKCEPNAQARKRLYVYGVSNQRFTMMLEAQRNRCAICLNEFSDQRKLCVDHDHTTNRIRGLLCQTCNKALGMLGDTYESVKRAMNYLQRAESENDML